MGGQPQEWVDLLEGLLLNLMAKSSLGVKNGFYIFKGLLKQTNKSKDDFSAEMWPTKPVTLTIWLFTKRHLLNKICA